MLNRISRAMEAFMSKPKVEGRVTVTEDGPYVVTGNIPLVKQTIAANADGDSESWTEGHHYPARQKYSLCRCGQSNTKPFCDGTHAKIGFDGTETASREPYLNQATTLDGPVLALTDAEGLCAFGRFCDPNGKVWNQVARTDDPQVRTMFIRQVGDCPAGRLVAWDKASGRAIEPHLAVSIGLIEDPAEGCSGPIWLRGGIAVVAADGFGYEPRIRVTLCRCGASRNKPFCDGAHASIKFKAP
jgi:CDGSH-type Zn-finger protein